MDEGPEGFDFFIGPGGMNTVSQKNNQKISFQIQPKGSSCKPKVTYTFLRKISAGTGIRLRWGIKAEGPGCPSGLFLPLPKDTNPIPVKKIRILGLVIGPF